MNISHNFLKTILNPLRETVSEASEAIMNIYDKDSFETEIKSDGSPVTEADNKANEIIIRALHNITPDIPAVTEETFNNDEDLPQGAYWLVDPLDGTKEFINKSKEFTVNIALIENSIPIFGIVSAPATGEVWAGSFFQRPSKFFRSVNYFNQFWKYKHIPGGLGGGSTPDPIRIVMSKSHQNDIDKEFLHFLEGSFINGFPISYTVVEKGSSLKLCAMADNEADIYPRFGPTSEWDIAAGHAYLISKGGRVCQMSSGEHLIYSKEDNILNPAFVGFRNTYLKDTYLPLIRDFYKKLV
jgi:3'(2'), 5'-bisphosphate nucleotidase